MMAEPAEKPLSYDAGLSRLLAFPAPPPARGTTERKGVKRIAVTLDEGLFDRIAMLAAASRVPMAEALRQLIVNGLNEHVAPRRRRR
jgi:hypothetical protein